MEMNGIGKHRAPPPFKHSERRAAVESCFCSVMFNVEKHSACGTANIEATEKRNYENLAKRLEDGKSTLMSFPLQSYSAELGK
jgi:hypothetical protein